ncbi:HAD-IA family hydrolase [Saccharospirillum impatiens]|uniref:HAD-IA family hydrolase n=1 Tax=Saccharospirillum impatiens TaxID=169438 RepID=UPI0003FC7C1D|nr:HAD-IA family hydrolase [Saccharospirillum impatiens]
MTRAKAILFDLDGTLVDSARGIHAALDEVLHTLTGDGCRIDEVRRWVGNGPEKLVERGLYSRGYEDDASLAHALFRDAYQRTLFQADVYPGVITGLSKLQRQGFKLACITNKSSHFTGRFLAELDLAPFFDRVLCGDEVERPKPDPQSLTQVCAEFSIEPIEAIMVGDSANDLEPAQAIGMPGIAVSYGYHGNVPLEQFGPLAICGDFDEVVDLCLAATKP